MDKVVIDIETKNTFSDVGGKQFLNKLDVSFVGVYSYSKNAYFSFFENQMKELDDFLRQAGLVIGFSINRFDVRLLKELESYCLNDVKVTKEVYDLARRQKYLLVPDRITGNNEKVELDFYEG